MEISMVESDWLAPYHLIPNAKFPPIAAFLNRSTYHTYHKSAKASPPPCPKSHGRSESMNELTINEPAKMERF